MEDLRTLNKVSVPEFLDIMHVPAETYSFN